MQTIRRNPKVLGLVWSSPLSIVMSANFRPLGVLDVAQQRPCRALGGQLGHSHCSLPSQLGFSQITAAPMPMPTHIAVRP